MTVINYCVDGEEGDAIVLNRPLREALAALGLNPDDVSSPWLTEAGAAALYAPIVHNHDALYAPIDHDHDGDYAPLSHGHIITDISGLTAALAGKADTIHTHAAADIVSGQLAMARIASGTPTGAKFVRDDGTLAIPTAGASALDDLTDVVISSPSADQVLKYSGANWINAAAPGGGGSFAPIVDLSSLAADGVTDDTTAFNAIIAANPNDVVYDGAGLTYRVTALSFPAMNRVIFRNFNFSVWGDTVPISATGLVYHCTFQNVFINVGNHTTAGRRGWDFSNFSNCTFHQIRMYGVDNISDLFYGTKNAAGSGPYYNLFVECYGGNCRYYFNMEDTGAISTGPNANTILSCRINPGARTAIRIMRYCQAIHMRDLMIEGSGVGVDCDGRGCSIHLGYFEGLATAIHLNTNSYGCLVDFPYFSSNTVKIDNDGTNNIITGHRDDIGGVTDNVTNVGGSVSDLDDLTDVVITSPASGQVLAYDGAQWENTTPAAASGSPFDLLGRTFYMVQASGSWNNSVTSFGTSGISHLGNAVGGNSWNASTFTRSFSNYHSESTAATNSDCGWYDGGGGTRPFVYRGNAAGRGGFEYRARFAFSQTQTNCKAFFGLRKYDAASLGASTPSNKLDVIAYGWDVGETTWQLLHNDASGACTKVNTSVSWAVDVVYEIRISCSPNGSDMTISLYTITAAAATQVHTATVSTNIPTNTAELTPMGCLNTGSSSSVVRTRFYFESAVSHAV